MKHARWNIFDFSSVVVEWKHVLVSSKNEDQVIQSRFGCFCFLHCVEKKDFWKNKASANFENYFWCDLTWKHFYVNFSFTIVLTPNDSKWYVNEVLPWKNFSIPIQNGEIGLTYKPFFTYDQKCQSFSFFKPAWMLVIEHELNVSKRNTNSRQINLQEKSHLGDGWTIWFSKHEQQPLRVCDLKGFVWVLEVWGNVLYWTVAIWDSYPKADFRPSTPINARRRIPSSCAFS